MRNHVTSPKRQARWSRHTSYPTVCKEKPSHVPAEISSATRANIKKAENQLEVSRNHLNNIQKKSLNHLDSQRRLLEQSMTAYSEKMTKISNSRTNELFREIHTRNALREDNDENSSTLSLKSQCSLPARVGGARASGSRDMHRHSVHMRLNGFKQVQICSPILEQRSKESTPVLSRTISRSADVIRRYTNSQRKSNISDNMFKPGSDYPSQNNTARPGFTVNGSNKQPTHGVRIQLGDSNGDYAKTGAQRKRNNVKLKPCVRIANGSIPWLSINDSYDSAYSSASEDLDTDFSDTTSVLSDMVSTCASLHSTGGISNNDLLTVPTIHIRKGSTKINRKRRKPDDLHQQVVLKNANDIYFSGDI